MNSSVLITDVVVAAIGFFVIFKMFRSHQENKEPDSSSSSSSPPPSSVPSSNSLIFDVFPSFRGVDVRDNFYSHLQKEFQRKGITHFADNKIKRGESIRPELISAIRGSKLAIVVLSRNYASSKWCLDELVEIMKCKKELDQIVLPIFYKVEPTDVKKLTGDFGEGFRKNCANRSKEETERWRKALEDVATTAGYPSINWDNEADMIENIATDVSAKLLNNVPSSVLGRYVGMRTHMGKMEKLLCLDSDEVRMIGIWGPSGIGKSTIARALFEEYSHEFEVSVFMDNIRRRYPIPCRDVYSTQLQLQTEMLSQITNQQDIKICHLDVAQDRLKHKRVLVVLDDVGHLMQLEALAKEARWFGPGSRIIMTTQDRWVLERHKIINHIHEVGFPSDSKALKIFCMYAFGQKSPYRGFESLAKQVTQLAGNLPVGLTVMGSYFRGMTRYEWEMELPRLWSSLNGEIESILKFSYDALCEEDKKLFIYIACFFNDEWIGRVEEFLAENISNVRHRLHVLADKSLIRIDRGWIRMYNLLACLGREIVRKQSIHGPGQRQFLVDCKETCQILSNSSSYTQGSINVIGIDCEYSEIEGGLYKNDKAFEKMSNLQFLRIGNTNPREHLPQSLKYLPRTLRLLDWDGFPMTCLPSNFDPEFLVEIYMPSSNLEKLWEGSQRIRNLKRVYLRDSENLKEVPDLSTATNLWKLDLSGCSSLVKLPSSIGNAINLNELFLNRCSSLVALPASIGNATKLKRLNLSECSSLVELPFSIGNATDLTDLDLRDCTSLVELPSSIGNLHNLSFFILKGCSKIEAVPVNLNMKSLRILDLADCSLLKTFPEICANVQRLSINGTGIEDIPSSIRLWSHGLYHFAVSYSESLVNSQHAFDLITELHVCDQRVQELAPWIKEMTRLRKLIISGCTKLVTLMQLLPDSLETLEAKNCESLERLDSSCPNKHLHKLDLSGCSSLVELPSSIGNATNLKELKLSKCSSLVELPSSIGNLHKLQRMILKGCTKLESLPMNNINMESLKEVDLADCSSLKAFPEISTNIERLKLKGTAIEDIPSSISSWCHLHHLSMPYSESLGKSWNGFDLITVLSLCDQRIRQLSPWIKDLSRLRKLVISGCTELVSLPQLPDSLRYLKAENCESLERVDSSSSCFQNVGANFGNCFKLNEEARELIIRSCRFAVLPGEQMPMYFIWQATGSSPSTKWNHHIPLMGFKACVMVVNKGDTEVGERKELDVYYSIKDGTTSVRHRSGIHSQRFPLLKEHIYTFEMEEKVSCRESSVFEFEVRDKNWEVKECGLKFVPQL